MKHAFLIMAHNEINLLKLLIQKIDHEDNDIFLHLDVKCKLDPKQLLSIPTYSQVHLIKRRNVSWGGYSQIHCEMQLLEKAVRIGYDYYHLLTGVDLPIKSVKTIHGFFEENNGYEFIGFDDIKQMEKNASRYDHWHFNRDYAIKNKHTITSKIYNKCVFLLERFCNTYFGNRSRHYPDIIFRKGSAYFDITHDFALYVVEHKRMIKKMFRHTSCCDEVFLHTIAFNSPFKHQIKNQTRFIDWSCGGTSPAVLTMQHYAAIQNSPYLFARKFSENGSSELISTLYGHKVDFQS